MAYYTSGTSISPRYCPILAFRDFGPGDILPVAKPTPPGANGYESDFDFYPKSLTLMSRHKILPNIFSAMGVIVCDKAFLDVLESFESGVHQVRPVRIFYKNGELIGGKFYYLNIVSRIDAIIVEKSEVRKYFDEKFTKREFFEIETIQSKRVLSKCKIEGNHIWRDRIMRTDIYISDEFYLNYKEMNFKGFNEFYHAEEI